MGDFRSVKSAVNAVFAFLVFLVFYGFFIPGHVKGSTGSPRFLMMTVEDAADAHEHVSISVPYAFFGGVLKMAATGRLERELAYHLDCSVDNHLLKSIVSDLEGGPDGTPVTREHDGEVFTFKKDGAVVQMAVARSATAPTEVHESDDEENDESSEPKEIKPPKAPETQVATTGAPAPPEPPSAPAPPAPERTEVTVRLPFRLLKAAVAAERDFDVSTLVGELQTANKGELVDVITHDAHVKVWVE